MNSESLQSLCIAVMLLGFVLTGLGGFGAVYFASDFRREREVKSAATEADLNARLAALQSLNDELRHRIEPFDQATRQLAVAGLKTGSAEPSGKNRVLSARQQHEIGEVLRKHPGRTITMNAVLGDTEGFEFAQTLKHTFVEAGWQVDGVRHAASAAPPVGLCLSAGSAPPPKEMIAAYLALTSAGFDVSQEIDPKLPPEQTTLTIGRNPSR